MDTLWCAFKDNEIDENELWIQMCLQRACFEGSGGFTATRYGDIDAFIETFKIKKFGREYLERKQLSRQKI